MYRRDTDVGVELVTVTVRKNPTFGFHIMGGVDAGGNPYRHDDDGVFITYVTPGGSADQLVKAGDKILLVRIRKICFGRMFNHEDHNASYLNEKCRGR